MPNYTDLLIRLAIAELRPLDPGLHGVRLGRRGAHAGALAR